MADTMVLWLVRHGSAGSRGACSGPDRRRPLDKKGRRQADLLIEALQAESLRARGSHMAPGRILSSPYARCIQTVEPLARAHELPVEPLEALAEGMLSEAVTLVRTLGDSAIDTVLCSHGDVVPAVLDALVRSDGLELGARPKWSKGSTWVLEIEGGRFVSASYVRPSP